MSIMQKAVSAYRDGGLSLIPINASTKRPFAKLLPDMLDKGGNPIPGKYGNRKTWMPYQSSPATDTEVSVWLSARVAAIAVVCGAVSGNLEIVDFDCCPTADGEPVDATSVYSAWRAEADKSMDMSAFPVQYTGGGGVQVAWRCDEIAGNQKLAWCPDATQAHGRSCIIETRGEGGYAVLPPSIHPSGNQYRVVIPRFSAVPMLKPDQREFLLNLARVMTLLDEPELVVPRIAPSRTVEVPVGGVDNVGVIDLYNESHSVLNHLLHYGYTDAGGGRYSRPGQAGSSGVILSVENNKAYAFSSNDAMTYDRNGGNQPFSPFDLYVTYGCEGDMKAALRNAAIELGVEYRLHTLILVDGREAARIVREEMFPRGWVVRSVDGSVNAADASDYDVAIIWADCQSRADAISRIAGIYGIAMTRTTNPFCLSHDGVLVDYLESVRADAVRSASQVGGSNGRRQISS